MYLYVLSPKIGYDKHCTGQLIDKVPAVPYFLFNPSLEFLPAEQVIDKRVVELHGGDPSRYCCHGGVTIIEVTSFVVSLFRMSALSFPFTRISAHLGLQLYWDAIANP